jgi:DNA-binding NtrC family response regulator
MARASARTAAPGPAILVAWIGHTDLRAVNESATVGLGPIAQAASSRAYDRIELLSDYTDGRADTYPAWLRGHAPGVPITVHPATLRGPTNFRDIYRAATATIDPLARVAGARLTFHLSSGTPAMAAVWIILAKSRYPGAELIESSRAHGVQTADVPFDLAAELLPDLLRAPDAALQRQGAAPPPAAPEFSAIIHRSEVMARLVDRARQVAPRSVPVLLLGETGTGKELFARAIHRASPRRDRPFVPVNCGALPPELVESTLFGHARGAFTGAAHHQQGVFEAADGGTLFLDELGELPLAAQVKLLRVLQEGEVQRVGEANPRKVDVRVIAATHRDLMAEMGAGRFREDLFYRLAVAVLRLPPLRERTGDLGLLIDHVLGQIEADLAQQPGFTPRRLTPAARRLLLNHPWPGNVRELHNTLLRATLWPEGASLDVDAIREALLPGPRLADAVLGRPLTDGFDLQALLDEVARHYLRRALDETANNKSRAAERLGLASYQTLTNWMNRLAM